MINYRWQRSICCCCYCCLAESSLKLCKKMFVAADSPAHRWGNRVRRAAAAWTHRVHRARHNPRHALQSSRARWRALLKWLPRPPLPSRNHWGRPAPARCVRAVFSCDHAQAPLPRPIPTPMRTLHQTPRRPKRAFGHYCKNRCKHVIKVR